jgi:hypothetical protein
MQRVFKVVALCGLFATLWSCGGGGGGGVPPARDDRTIGGVAFDGPVLNGTVNIFDFTGGTKGELLATGPSDGNGHYSLSLRIGSRPILVEVAAGRYVEEASRTVVNFAPGQVLRAVYNYNYEAGTDFQVAVTYYTNIATGLAEYLVSTGVAVADAVAQANQRIQAMTGVDITAVQPLDVTDADNKSTELSPGLRYGFLTSSISQWTKWVSEQNGLPPHNPYSSLFFAQLAYDDIKFDGVLDGLAGDSDGAAKQLALGNVDVDGNVYRNELALNVVVIGASEHNVTGIPASQLIEVANAFSSSASVEGLFPADTPAAPFADAVPIVGNVSPTEGQLVAGTLAASAAVADQVGLAKVEFFVDGNLAGTASNLSFPAADIVTAALADGAHTLRIVATNVLGNKQEHSVGFLVANKGTVVANVRPADNAFVPGKFTMSADVADPAGIRSVRFADDAGNAVLAADPAQPTAEIDTQAGATKLKDGAHSFTVTAENSVGHTASATVTYRLDTVAPQVSLSGIADGAVVKGKLAVKGTVSDANGIASAAILFNGVAQASVITGNEISASIDTAPKDDGTKPLSVRATDRAGNSAVKSINVLVDNTPPAVTIRSPSDGETVSGTFVFAANVVDGSGVGKAELVFDGKPQSATVDATNTVRATVSVAGLTGTRTALLRVTDKAGNVTERSVTVTVDNDAPSVNISGLDSGAFLRGTVNVTVSAQAAGGIRSVDFYVDNSPVKTFTAGFDNMVYAMDTSKLSEGDHQFKVFVTGQIRNATVTRDFTVDRTSPVINASIAPLVGGWVGAKASVTATIGEPNLATATASVAGKSQPLSASGSSFSAAFDLAGLNGKQSVEVTATDKAGNTTSKSFDVNVDTAVPQLAWSQPAAGSIVSGKFNAEATADDKGGSGVASAAFFFDGVSYPAASSKKDTWSAEITVPAGASGGEHILEFQATDAVGNAAARAARTVIVDSAPPVLAGLADKTVPASGSAGAVVSFTVTAQDAVDGAVAVTCAPASGATFPVGVTTVGCSAKDKQGNEASGSFKVTVEDKGAPVLSGLADQTASATSAAGAVVSFTVTAQDAVDGAVAVTCAPASGATFPVGVTTVNCSAKDKQGNEASGSFKVTVEDKGAPVLSGLADQTVPATGATGAVVSFTVTAQDAIDGAVPVICTPTSGSTFAVGQTKVECSAKDKQGNEASGAFVVTVEDTAAPVLEGLADRNVPAADASGATVTFTVTAQDAVDGSVPVSCESATGLTSGSVFPLGDTTVNCVASDKQGNKASGSFVVTVKDQTAPVLAGLSDQTATATDPGGAVVTFNVTAQDAVDGPLAVDCSPSSGSTFPIGPTLVRCSATDDQGNVAEGTFTITVQDSAGPVLTGLVDQKVEATGPPGAVLTFQVSAVDAVDGPVPIACKPPSGSTFPIGTTKVDCSATDKQGNKASGSFAVTVEDTTAPLLTGLNDRSAEATGPKGAQVSFEVTAKDSVDGQVSVSCKPAAGSEFALGVTEVDCSAKDKNGNSVAGKFTVTVVDTTPPVLMGLTAQSLEATDPDGATATFEVTAQDTVDGAVTVACSAMSGSPFPLGPTTVACSAEDAQKNRAAGSFVVTVVDTTGPELAGLADQTLEASGPDGAPAAFDVTASDLVDGISPVVCDPVTGSMFPLGPNKVTCESTDSAKNTTSDGFTITVVDTTPPVLSVPPDMSVTGVDGTLVTFDVTAQDAVNGDVAVQCIPASGTAFALGATTVSCEAADVAGNIAQGSFFVTLVAP